MFKTDAPSTLINSVMFYKDYSLIYYSTKYTRAQHLYRIGIPSKTVHFLTKEI